MKSNYTEIAIVGLKVLASVASGLAIFAGLSSLFGKNQTNSQQNIYDLRENPEKNISHNNIEENYKEDENMKKDCKEDQTIPSRFNSDKFNEAGSKIIHGIQVSQAALSGAINIIGGVATVANNIKRVFDPDYYKGMLDNPNVGTGYFGTQMIPSYAYGDYPWNRPQDPGLPYNTPVYRGQNEGDDIWWVRKQNNVIEVW